MKYSFSVLLILVAKLAKTLDGNSVFNFLKLFNTPQLTALDGINVYPLAKLSSDRKALVAARCMPDAQLISL